MNRQMVNDYLKEIGVPRACGDEPDLISPSSSMPLRSPRIRG